MTSVKESELRNVKSQMTSVKESDKNNFKIYICNSITIKTDVMRL